jgi:uncharacterized protein
MTKTYCYTSPKLVGREMPEKGFAGLFAIEPVAQGEVLTVYMGEIINGEQLAQLPPADQVHILQIEDDLYIAPIQSEDAHLVNHSCDPNTGFSGQVVTVALRDIEAGEEICFDYAMCDGSSYDEFTCLCGAPHCRGVIRGSDWSLPELWIKYAGYFSPYLQRRIDEQQMTRG